MRCVLYRVRKESMEKKANWEKREKEMARKGRGREEEERKWSLFNLVFARCFCVKVSRRRRTGERKDKKKKKKMYHERDFSTVLPTKDSSYNGMSSCIRQQKKKKNKIKPLGKIVVHCITREQARHCFFVHSLSFFSFFFQFLCSPLCALLVFLWKNATSCGLEKA